MTNPQSQALTSKPMGEPSQDELRAAYAREVKHRPHWPATFELAEAVPLVRGLLRLLALGARNVSYGRRAAPIKPHAGRFEPSLIRPETRAVFDQKRLASGEKPEPDDT